jgi:enoyl-[acyl-carrier protein] reductase II
MRCKLAIISVTSKKVSTFVSSDNHGGNPESLIRRIQQSGVEGIELGTRFVAVKESNADHNYQQTVVEAQETDTVVIERSMGRPARVLRGRIPEQILEMEETLDREHGSVDERLRRLLPLIMGKVNTRAAIEGF